MDAASLRFSERERPANASPRIKAVNPILELLRGEWGRLGLSAVLVSLSALLELVPHLLVYAAANTVFSPSPDPEALYTLAAAAFGAVVLRFLLLGAGYITSHAVAFRVMRKVRLALTDKLRRVPGSFLSEHSTGDLKKTIVDDVASLEGMFAHNLPELASGLFVPLAAVFILLWTDWRLALISVALLPVAFVVQSVTMSGFEAAWQQWHEAEARANAGVLEFIRGITVLRAFNRDASSLARVRDGIYGIRDMATQMTQRTMVGYAAFFSLLAGNLAVVLPASFAFYLSGTITRDELVLFVALGAGMLIPLPKLLFLFGNLQKIRTALARIRAVLLAEELSEPEVSDQPSAHPDVRLNRVSFTYPGRDRPAVDELSIVLKPGTVTAVVGPSGAGKTTLTKLLTRAYDVNSGSIEVAGVDLRKLTTDQRTGAIGHVSQDTILFDGTIRDNLLLARPGASEDDLEAAARAAHAHDFIVALPEGYDTQIGDRGGRLSGGERQRLSIARALLKGAPIVVMDEPTANVDPQSERGIQEGLSVLVRERTVLVVAHRLRTIVAADQILVMDGGRLVEAGTHEALLERSSLYAMLWRDQENAMQWALGGAS